MSIRFEKGVFYFAEVFSALLSQLAFQFFDRQHFAAQVSSLVPAIEGYVAGHNEQPKPFIWTAKTHRYPGQDDARPGSAQYCAIRVTHHIY